MSFSCLLPPTFVADVQEALKQDVPTFDVGGFVVGDEICEAALLFKSHTPGVLAGKPFFDAVFAELGCAVTWHAEEGQMLTPPMKAATVVGPCRKLLLGERTALNYLARLSGIATQARRLAEIKAAAGWHGEVAATRKVTPGAFRLGEKYAVLVGGCSTHRMDLSQMVMLKDNHIWAAGSIAAAVKKARVAAGFSMKIEVECRDLEEAYEAAGAGADVIMLDNYTPEALAVDAAALKSRYPHVLVEASGGIKESTISGYFSPHVDVISLGTLTQGYSVVDFSLKVAKGAGVASIEKVLTRGTAVKPAPVTPASSSSGSTGGDSALEEKA